MMYPRIGAAELVILCVFGLFNVGLPVALLVLAFMIYDKLKKIEQKLNSEK
jgi:hypothetical protein